MILQASYWVWLLCVMESTPKPVCVKYMGMSHNGWVSQCVALSQSATVELYKAMGGRKCCINRNSHQIQMCNQRENKKNLSHPQADCLNTDYLTKSEQHYIICMQAFLCTLKSPCKRKSTGDFRVTEIDARGNFIGYSVCGQGMTGRIMCVWKWKETGWGGDCVLKWLLFTGSLIYLAQMYFCLFLSRDHMTLCLHVCKCCLSL